MKVLAVIVARGGSKGLPNKNILPLCGIPVIGYTIEDARSSTLCNRIICSTDDDAIAEIVTREGVEVIDRPAELAQDNTPIEDVLRHAVEHVAAHDGYVPDIIVLLYGNVPVRAEGVVDRTIEALAASSADAAITVADVGRHHPNWMVTLDQDNEIHYYAPGCIYRRQDLPACYIQDGGVIAIRQQALMARYPKTTLYGWMGRRIRAVVQRPHESVDIDDARDMMFAEAIIRSREEVLA